MAREYQGLSGYVLDRDTRQYQSENNFQLTTTSTAITGTSALVATAATSAAAGVLTFTGTSALTAAPATSSASGLTYFDPITGTSDVTANPATSEATGTVTNPTPPTPPEQPQIAGIVTAFVEEYQPAKKVRRRLKPQPEKIRPFTVLQGAGNGLPRISFDPPVTWSPEQDEEDLQAIMELLANID